MPVDSFLFRHLRSSGPRPGRCSFWCIADGRGRPHRAGDRRQRNFSVRLEAIVIWEPAVRLARLPFDPGALEEGGEVLGVGVSATNPSEEVETQAQAQYHCNGDDDGLDELC
jgi:hypothetical protein